MPLQYRIVMTDFNEANKEIILKSFIKGRFNYYPLLWIFSTRAANHKIIRLHEGELKALLNDETTIFKDMLSKMMILLFM